MRVLSPSWVLPWCLGWLLFLLGASSGRGAAETAGKPTPFESMDRHALAAPESVAVSPASLAAYLIKPARNPWEKARVIFRWIAHHIDYDINSVRAGTMASADPEVVLRRRMAVCTGYARLFAALCQEAGIEAEYVTGHSREYGAEENAELADHLRWALGYKVQVKASTQPCLDYPTTFAGFAEHNVYLSAPLTGRLRSNTIHQFHLRVPGAEMVYVKAGDQQAMLQARGDQFTGALSPPPGDLFLFAVFAGKAESAGLLRYLVE